LYCQIKVTLKMRRTILTATLMMTALFIAAGTVSAQETKKVEKKVVIVTVEDNGTTKDTTIIEGDTINFEGGNLIINTREGRRIIPRPGPGSRMVWAGNMEDMPGGLPEAVPGRPMGPGGAMRQPMPERDGVSYSISVDGVVVTIRAPREKAGEADQILNEVKKILMKK
jgi:hypothetical protein